MNQHNHIAVSDPKFSALRGEEASASRKRQRDEEERESLAHLDGDFRLPLDHRIEENVDLTSTDMTTLNTFLPASNVGYQMLQKMGWKAGTGLGKQSSGIVEPVSIDATDNGIRIGLGRAEVEKQYTDAELIQRRALETELQAFEDEERTKKREMEAERQQKIREDVTTQLKTFYCETCRKQYSTAMELDGHLSSYDHHHVKRMQETRAMMSERSRGDRGKKQKKAQEKEMERLAEQLRRAQQAQHQGSVAASDTAVLQQQQNLPPLPLLPLENETRPLFPPSPPPPLPSIENLGDTITLYDPLEDTEVAEAGNGNTGWQVNDEDLPLSASTTAAAAAVGLSLELKQPVTSTVGGNKSLNFGLGGLGKKPAAAGGGVKGKGPGIFGDESSDDE